MRPIFLCAVVALMVGAGAASAFAEEHVVGQKNRAFTVGTIEAKVGDEVLFQNDDGIFHSIFTLSETQPFDLGAYGPGVSKKVKLVKVGKIEVECAIHPRMKMIIDVKK